MHCDRSSSGLRGQSLAYLISARQSRAMAASSQGTQAHRFAQDARANCGSSPPRRCSGCDAIVRPADRFQQDCADYRRAVHITRHAGLGSELGFLERESPRRRSCRSFRARDAAHAGHG